MSATYRAAFVIGADHPALPGHFPGNPVVPGVVLLERVAAACKAWRGDTVGALDAKFLRPLLPDEPAAVELREDGSRVRFDVVRADGEVLARGAFAAQAIDAVA